MSKRNKLYKFAEIQRFPNVFENFEPKTAELLGENGEPVQLKGEWGTKYFKNNHPITLELACGRGEYTLGLARLYPERNYIGVDIKGARIWQGAKVALEEEMNHVGFLRTRIEMIDQFFAAGEIDEIWITFPDPFERKSKANRRLTSPPFLKRYSKILKPGGILRLKTDANSLYEYTLEVLKTNDLFELQYEEGDIYSKPLKVEALSLKTYYERMHLEAQKTIKYIEAKFVPPGKD